MTPHSQSYLGARRILLIALATVAIGCDGSSPNLVDATDWMTVTTTDFDAPPTLVSSVDPSDLLRLPDISIEGRVKVRIAVSETGDIELLGTPEFTNASLRNACITALADWEFEAATQDDRPVRYVADLLFFDWTHRPFDGWTVAPRPRTQIAPKYPRDEDGNLVRGGRVTMVISTDAFGLVPSAKIVASENDMLNEASLTAVRQWTFYPARNERGEPMPSRIIVPLEFSCRTCLSDSATGTGSPGE